MAPVQKISSYSVASSASSSSTLTPKVTENGDYRTESSEQWHTPLFIAPSGTTFDEAFFENARARFHHELTNFLAEWGDTEDVDDAWFGKETTLSRRLSPETQLSSHSKIRDNKFAVCVNENGDYEVMMNMSELKLKDFKVTVTGERSVTVEGYKEEGNMLRSCHRSPRIFLYQFSLPDNASSDAISAVFSRDGILTIIIPSKEQTTRHAEVESSEQCGRKSRIIEIQKCQSPPETSESNLTESSHQCSFKSSLGPMPLVRVEEEEFQTLKKKEDSSLLTDKNRICIDNSIESLKNNSSSTSSSLESKDSFSQRSLAKERQVRETIIPIRMEESREERDSSHAQSEITIFHHSSLNKKDSCQDRNSLDYHQSSNVKVALCQSEESLNNSTELHNEVLRCTPNDEQNFGRPKHSTYSRRSEGIHVPSEGNIKPCDTECNEVVTATNCITGTIQSRNTEPKEHTILSEVKNSETTATECAISERAAEEKTQVVNFRTVDLHRTSCKSEEETRYFLCDSKRGDPTTSGISHQIHTANKGRLLEDSHFVSVRALVISAITEILSRNGSVLENGDLVGFYRKCQEENVTECDALTFSKEEDSSYKFVVDICNFMRESLTVCVKNGKEIRIEGRHQPKRGTLQHSEDFTKSLVLPKDAVTDSASASVSSDGFLLVSVDKEGSFETKSKAVQGEVMVETSVANQHSEEGEEEEEEEAKVFKEANKLSQEHQGQQVLHKAERSQDFVSGFSAASSVSCASVAASHGISEEQIGSVKDVAEEQEKLSVSEAITPKVIKEAKFINTINKESLSSVEQEMDRIPCKRQDSNEFQNNNSFLKREQQQQSLLEIQTLETSANGVTEEVVQEQQDYLVTSPSSTPFEETGKLQELEASVTAIEELQGISSTDTCSPLLVQQKGLFDEDAFYESARHYFKLSKIRTSHEHADAPFIRDDDNEKRIIPLLDDQEEYEKTNCFDNENEYTIVLNVGGLLKETQMEVKVVSGNKILIRCSSSLNEGELDHLRVFSKTFHLPDEIDVTSGLCGISLDGILAITFTKKVQVEAVQLTSLGEACSNGSSQKDGESFNLGGKSVLTLEEPSNREDFTGQELTLSLSQEQVGEINSSYSEEAITGKTTTTGDELCEESESFSKATNDFWQATCSTTHDASHSCKMTHESESVQDPLLVMNAGESESREKTLLMRETIANDAMNRMMAGVMVEEVSPEEIVTKNTSSDGQSQTANMRGRSSEHSNVIKEETAMMEQRGNINTSLELFTLPSLFEHQELKSSLQTVGKGTDRFSGTRNGIILNVEEKGLFDEDAFFERARSLFVNRTDRLSSVGDKQTNFKNLPFTTHGEENKVATFSDDEQHYMAVLDVSRCTNKAQLNIQVREQKELLIEYPVIKEGESENAEHFSMTFNLPCGIDVESGVCGISSDDILFIVFSKTNLENIETKSSNQSEAKTYDWYSLNGIPPSKGNLFQNEGIISGAEKCEASAQECFVSSTTYSGVCNLKEQSNSNIKLLPITRKGNFFQDSFFQEVQHLFQRAIKKVLKNSTDQETCRHASDIKTYKCLRKQNPDWKNHAFHVEDDHISCQILLDVENVTEESTTVYVTEEKDLVIEGQLKTEEESSSQLRTCRRCFSLPSNVDFSEGTAALSSDGILYVAFQKTNVHQQEKED